MGASRGAAAAFGVACAFASGIAAAGPPAANGFTTTADGELRGRVSREDGSPAANVAVHVVTARGGERIVRTDKEGSFAIALHGGGETNVFITEAGRITGTTTHSDDEAVIEMENIEPPAVAAVPRKSSTTIPAYTDAAMDADTWTRAWLMLEIDATGKVRHVKLVGSAGYGLDEIAVREAFALRFEAARDRAGRPIRSLAMWTFEWPPYWWMRHEQYPLSRLPAEALKTSCRRAGQRAPYLRDCTRPDLRNIDKLPWIAVRLRSSPDYRSDR